MKHKESCTCDPCRYKDSFKGFLKSSRTYQDAKKWKEFKLWYNEEYPVKLVPIEDKIKELDK